MLKCQGVPLILGLRDVLDEPAQLAEEWQRKNVAPALTDLYDHIWVYGLPEFAMPSKASTCRRSAAARSAIPAICAARHCRGRLRRRRYG